MGRALSATDFEVKSSIGDGVVKTLVAEIMEGSILTKKLMYNLTVKNGLIETDPSKDVIKIGVIERHRATGNVGKGFVKGFGLKKGAIASSVGHDAHNIIVLGVREGDMAFAANVVSDMDGGLLAVDSGHVLAKLELPIAGLMSDRSVDEVASKLEMLDNAAQRLGMTVDNPYSALSFMSLAVVPELRVTDKGVVDVDRFTLTSLTVTD
jgi:adenine deaminase